MSEPSVDGPSGGNQKPRREPSRAPWLSAAILGALFGAAVWYAVYGWNLVPNKMDTRSYVAIALGIVFTAALGGGLMALLFWSHRKGYDR